MSFRKHFPPDFPELIELIKQEGFKYLDRYRRAEAMAGDSNSINLINTYFYEREKVEPILKYSTLVQGEFLDDLAKERKYVCFERAFDAAYDTFYKNYVEKQDGIPSDS